MYNNTKKDKNKIMILGRRNHFIMATMFAFAMVFIFSLISSKAYAACTADVDMGTNSITNVGGVTFVSGAAITDVGSITFSGGGTLTGPIMDYVTFYKTGTSGEVDAGKFIYNQKVTGTDPNGIFSIDGSGNITATKDGLYYITTGAYGTTTTYNSFSISCNNTEQIVAMSYGTGHIKESIVCALTAGQNIYTTLKLGDFTYAWAQAPLYGADKPTAFTTIVKLN